VQIEIRGRNTIIQKKNKKTRLHQVTFKGDEILIDGEPAGRISLDPSKSPKHLNLDYNGVDPGIYRLDNDVLQICWSAKDGQRPKEFKTDENDPNRRLLTLKRVAKK